MPDANTFESNMHESKPKHSGGENLHLKHAFGSLSFWNSETFAPEVGRRELQAPSNRMKLGRPHQAHYRPNRSEARQR